MLSIGDTPKTQRYKEIGNENGKSVFGKKVGVAMLISDKKEFKTKEIY